MQSEFRIASLSTRTQSDKSDGVLIKYSVNEVATKYEISS